ncbi:MAG: sugar-binding protein [Bacteroidales bacterium]
MKYFILFIILAGLQFTNITGQPFVVVSRTASPPIIDGYIEDAWDDASEYPISCLFAGAARNMDDFSASWKGLWDDDNIYFFISVSDDSLYNLGTGASKFWIHDCVELFFDLLNNKDLVSTDDSPSDDNYQYRFIWNLDNEPIYENPPAAGLENVSRTVSAGEQTKGYTMEIKIPWATLIGTHPFGIPVKGDKIGFEIKIADLDKSTVAANVWAPDAEITWANKLKKDLKISANFGTLQLVESALNDTIPPHQIENLILTPVGSSSIDLKFISPADSNTGMVKDFQVWLSNDSISTSNLNLATLLDSFPVPLPAGALQEFVIDNLPEGHFIWVALQSTDYFGNTSLLSPSFKVRTFDPDSIGPAAVNDLAADSVGSFSVFLSFTSTGDDSLTGRATSYDLRYMEGELSGDNWSGAVKVDALPEPADAGNMERINIRGLKPDHTYSFGLKVIDERPNTSALSNIITVTTPVYVHRRIYTMDQFIGTNAFIDVPQEKMKAVGFIREYHPWSFTEEVNDQFEYNKWNGFWDFDNYYKLLKEAGIDVCPALWGSPSWLKSSDLNKPVVGTESPLLPNSYREMAELMFQYAARYGSKVIDNSQLIVGTGQVKKSGLGYLRYYEDWNEQDRSWEGPDKRFTPQEYAAMASANIDGHCGTMGANLGLRQADPDARFVMGGLAGLGTDYVNQMMQWFSENRPDKLWPVDVINMHHYCDKNGLIGTSPEDGLLKQKVAVVAQWRDENAPESEFWLTEFGYDMNSQSVNRVPVFAGFTQEQVQAQWLLRSFLILSSTGVDRAAQFMLRNQEPTNAEPRFRDCGLTSSHNIGYIPKLSWYAVYLMKNTLAGLYFDQFITENSDVWAYRYTHPDSSRQVVALWSPTSSGKTYSYRMPVPGGFNSATLVSVNGTISGSREPLEVSAGKVLVPVSEMPVFVEFSLSTLAEDVPGPDRLEVFPNPVSELLTVRWTASAKSEVYTISLFDSGGRILSRTNCPASSGNCSVETGMLAPGIYFISVSGNNFNSRKLINKIN